MSEIAKFEPGSLTGMLKTAIVEGVSVETRRLAVEAVSWFADRPSKSDLDQGLTALKLAALFHRRGVTLRDVTDACFWLDKNLTFRPVIADFERAIEVVTAAKQVSAFSDYRVHMKRGITTCNCREDMVADLEAQGWVRE